MNKVITINLNGVAYQLEEGGYEALREYLDNAARRLAGNPDRDEIIADIEQAIADKFRALLGAHKTVVITKEVAVVITEMGPVEDATKEGPAAESANATAGAGPAAPEAGETKDVRRLYRIYDGAMISGVCNGLGAYFGIDPTIIRIAFVLLTLAWGTGALVYFLLVLLIPSAKTPAEKSAATGVAATAQEFIRRAKAGYYEGFRTFHDKQAHREWRRRFKQEMRGWTQGLQRDVRENAHHWMPGWQQNPPPQPPPFGAVIAWPFLSLLKLVLFVALLFAVLSLVGDGHIFGIGLPLGIPLWVGVVFLIVAFHVFAWPLKMARRACRYPGYYGYRPPLAGLWDSLVWLACMVGLVWLADHYSPRFHEWLMDLPPMVHQFMDSVREWWARR